jgi:thioester reductase-like protein
MYADSAIEMSRRPPAADWAKLSLMPRPGYDSVLLVTGYPSLHARRMVEQIITAEPRSLVYVLVPPPPAKDEPAEPPAEPPELELSAEQRARVVFLEGSPHAMDLGLSGAEFRQITREVDRVHHLAHVASSSVDRAIAHTANVVGAAEILEFSRAAPQLSCLVFHSTAHVSGDRTGVVHEDDLACGQSFRSDADETRMRAEVLLRRAMREVPIAVVRPTTIVGDTGAGENDRLEGIYLLVLLVVATPAEIAIPFPGRGDTPLNIVPLDYALRAAHAIGRHPSAPGRTFHLADPNPLSARSVFELVTHAGGRRTARGSIPSNLAKALLRTPGIDRFARSPKAFVEQLTSDVRYDTRNTEYVLRSSGIVCPPFESYVDDLVNVVREHIKARQRRRESHVDEVEIDDALS